jgi:hypothetical protein
MDGAADGAVMRVGAADGAATGATAAAGVVAVGVMAAPDWDWAWERACSAAWRLAQALHTAVMAIMARPILVITAPPPAERMGRPTQRQPIPIPPHTVTAAAAAAASDFCLRPAQPSPPG